MPPCPPAVQSSSGHPERRQVTRPLRIILADDERDTVETLAAYLRTDGHHVYAVDNGREVLPAIAPRRLDPRYSATPSRMCAAR